MGLIFEEFKESLGLGGVDFFALASTNIVEGRELDSF